MGIVTIAGIAIFLVISIALILGILCKGRSETCMKVVTMVKQKLLWNSLIRYSLQSYLKLAFANFGALTSLAWGSSNDQAQSVFVLIMSSILCSLPFIYTKVLHDTSTLREAHVQQKIGSLILGIRSFNHAQALYSVVFISRRFFFVVLLIGLKE